MNRTVPPENSRPSTTRATKSRMTREDAMNRIEKLLLHAAILSCVLFGGAAASASGELKYDFGPRGNRAAEGCIRVGIEQQYTRETGFGFVYRGAGESTGSRQRSG